MYLKLVIISSLFILNISHASELEDFQKNGSENVGDEKTESYDPNYIKNSQSMEALCKERRLLKDNLILFYTINNQPASQYMKALFQNEEYKKLSKDIETLREKLSSDKDKNTLSENFESIYH